MKWNRSPKATESAAILLPKLAEKYFRAGRKAVEKEAKPKDLHRFRIATKRFRYALEIFRPIYGATLDRHLKLLRGIQDALGKVSDYQSIQRMIADDKPLKHQVQKAQSRKIKEFHAEWNKFDSDGQLKRWKAYLTRTRRPPRKRSVRKKSTPAA